MKKLLFLIGIGFLGTFNLVSQNPANGSYGWRLVSGGTTQTLNKVHFADPSTGYISGSEALIMKSSNGGESWSHEVLPSLSDFWCVYAVAPDVAYIGAWDTVYTTRNGGAIWTGIPTLSTNFSITDIQFLNPLEGVAMLAGSTCFTTGDGGATWTFKGGVGAIEDFYGSHFLTKDYGFAVGDCGLIAKTIDGGENWEAYRWDEYVNWSCLKIFDVFFTSTAMGFAVADSGYLFKTDNSGSHWSKVILGEETDQLKSICFINSSTGYIAGSKGKIYKTNDGGDTWNLEDVPTENNLNSIFFVADSVGFAVGEQGTILLCHAPGSSGTDPETIVSSVQVSVFPNPVQHTMSIAINQPEASIVQIDLFQIDGRWVKKMADKMIQAGKQTIRVSLDGVPKGTYLCKVTAKNWHKQLRIIVL